MTYADYLAASSGPPLPELHKAAPYRPPMNYQERARRAELLADRLAQVLGDIVTTTWPAMADEECSDAQAALDAWTAHRADLDCLEQGGTPNP